MAANPQRQTSLNIKPPCNGFGFRKCCFCCTLDPDYVCYFIANVCIILCGFDTTSLIYYKSVFDILARFFGFVYYLVAGLCLAMGTLYMKPSGKYIYCYMMFLGLIYVVIVPIVYDGYYFFTYGRYLPNFVDCHECVYVLYIAWAARSAFLICFSVYTPFIVMGNMETYRLPQTPETVET